MSITLARPTILSGAFVEHMDEDEYHAHPALSYSGMKQLLRSPMHYRMYKLTNRTRPEFDVGHACHARILGVGMPIVEIPTRLLSSDGGIRTNDAKAFVAETRAEGKIPLKPAVYGDVVRASDAVLRNAKARDLLERPGFTELSLFADDPVTGVHLRCRLDRLADVPIDVKSTTDVQIRKVTNTVIDFGYDIQAETYRTLIELVTGEKPEPMNLIFFEKDAPYEVRVVRLTDPVWHARGEMLMRAAIDLFAWCTEQDAWPGEDEDGGEIRDLVPPAWLVRQLEGEEWAA